MPSAYLVNQQSSPTSRVLVTVTAIIVALLAVWTVVSIMMSHYFVAKQVPADIQVASQPQPSVSEKPAPASAVLSPPDIVPPLSEPVHVGSFPSTASAAFAEVPDLPPVPKPREMKALLEEIRIDPIEHGPLSVPLPPPRPRSTDAASAIPMPRPRPDLGDPEFVIEPYIARMN